MASDDPSRRASVASSSDMSLVAPAVASKVVPKSNKPSGTTKPKNFIAKNTKPKDGDSKAGSPSPFPDSPSINGNDTESRASVPASQTGEDATSMVRCKHCKKPVVKSSMASHFKICPEKKPKEKIPPKKKDSKDGQAKPAAVGNDDKDAEGARDDSPTVKAASNEAGHGPDGISSAKNVIKSAKKSASKEAKTGATDGSSKQTKKRKADMEGDKEPKKKKLKKDEPPKPKVAKPKGPVDVEKQCGVLLPNGGYCARSLTCKSHSMGAKRAVPGRSMPYDFLLAQYQKKNQAKQQKAAMDANAPLADDTDAHVPVDSDEEKDAVMAAIARWRPQPLAQHTHISLRRKHQRLRVKEALAQALAGNRGASLFAIRPPETQTTSGLNQMATATAGSSGAGTAVDGVHVTARSVGTGGGGQASEGGAAEGRPSLVQQALGANMNSVAGGNGASAGAAGSQSRKSSITTATAQAA
ncbi:MAG: hypothetical protein LQ341_000134 [Variospora aurantia]|nr:MAG: hypothetical protein LQ341_000134 [Variospora aurantia]